MGTTECAHWIGLLGEGLNLGGAAVLARDLFNRKREHAFGASLSNMSAEAREEHIKSSTYRGIPVASPDFAVRVMHLYATKLGYWGLGLLMAGFLCLAAYHVMEIRGTSAQPTAEHHYSLDKKF